MDSMFEQLTIGDKTHLQDHVFLCKPMFWSIYKYPTDIFLNRE